MRCRILGAISALVLLCIVATSCSRAESLGRGFGKDDPTNGIIPAEAGTTPQDASDLLSYCPSDHCPAGHTTCSNSLFTCDVDLRTDPNNCGECGNACPAQTRREKYSCFEGRCVMACQTDIALDCDGIPDNGCEVDLPNNDNCGGCGLKCPADKPCIERTLHANDFGCGCTAGEIYCPGPLEVCVDPTNNDSSCGACNNACPPEGDGSERPANMYFGCEDNQCGALKCIAGYGDCDGRRDNGCELYLTDDDNCGACGNKCSNGASCRLNPSMVPECMCPSGQTFCEAFCAEPPCGYCADFSSDSENCGGCGSMCRFDIPNANEACVYGKCERSCKLGWSDCNGNRDDGCETNIFADPKNCGACGKVCDGIAGQACVDGECMVEPCGPQQDAGGPTR
ncbi:hypothetical protein AKJ09_02305 [Labilithrix luteola]|uniref:Tryptophan synthase alpha chain n=1 Tax=Labilithrix luteola TaxID=1391654 RepID=A0A0K1PQH6_9BACT|nr:hypothetical protein [Labilithrix luteola]AKU95641.1 hypothetical protein AKJ09_02305 [Labilithrix luteola]